MASKCQQLDGGRFERLPENVLPSQSWPIYWLRRTDNQVFHHDQGADYAYGKPLKFPGSRRLALGSKDAAHYFLLGSRMIVRVSFESPQGGSKRYHFFVFKGPTATPYYLERAELAFQDIPSSEQVTLHRSRDGLAFALHTTLALNNQWVSKYQIYCIEDGALLCEDLDATLANPRGERKVDFAVEVRFPSRRKVITVSVDGQKLDPCHFQPRYAGPSAEHGGSRWWWYLLVLLGLVVLSGILFLG